MSSKLRRELRLKDLVFFNICAVVSLRWVASAAHAGPGSLVLWLIAAVLFFLPCAITVTQLSERFPEDGGMYIWTKRAFGDRHAFVCGWFYFISTILYFPSLVLAGVSMSAYVFGEPGQRFSENPWLVVPTTLAVLWSAFAANFFGMKVAKWISVLGGSATFIIGGAIGLLALLVAFRSGSATHFNLMPDPSWDTLNFWSQIAFAFVGLELASLVSGEIKNPRRDLPRAALISGLLSAAYYIGVTAALLVLLKPEDVNPMTGIAQAGGVGAMKLGVPVISILLSGLIGFALLGQLDTWVAGNTRLPYAVGLDHYLPASFSQVHPRWRTPYVSLLWQAVAATLFLLVAQLGETVKAAYQILVDMTVIITFIPFIYIFAAGFRFASRTAAVCGLAVTLIAIVLSALPPPGIASAAIFLAKVIGGSLFFAASGLLLFRHYHNVRSEPSSPHVALQ